MARFRGTLKGNRGMASRLGTASSGLTAEVNGWNTGVIVLAGRDERDRDTFDIHVTGGSNVSKDRRLLATVIYDPVTGERQIVTMGAAIKCD